MKRRSLIRSLFAVSIGGLFVAREGRSETYLTVDRAKSLMFPGERLSARPTTLSKDQQKAIAKASGVRVRSSKVNAWRASSGGWLIVDNVIGKHEFIDFAVSLTSGGSVKRVEVLTYRESYGSEVRHPKWMAQFRGKTTGSTLRVDKDIKNISGATLSSVHITDGVKRLLNTWAIALR